MDLREIARKTAHDVRDAHEAHWIDLIESALRSVAPRWVPVGEGLPPRRQDVPLLQPNGTWVKGWYERERERDCFWTITVDGPCLVEATHWQPLPPPPKEPANG